MKSWAARNATALKTGGLVNVLVLLSLGTAAQAQEASVNIASLEGVKSVEVLADGTARVTFENGQSSILQANTFTVNAVGEIIVSPAVAAQVEGFIALGGGAASTTAVAVLGGGMGLAAAVGGGGSGSGGGSGGGGVAPANSGVGGTVVDGYIMGARVFQDLNGNSVLDAGEPNVVTDANGNFSGLVVDASNPDAPLISVGGTDISTGQPFQGVMTAPSNAQVISPLTTLVQSYAEASGVSAEDAEAAISQSLGLSGGESLLEIDPFAQNDGGSAFEVAAQVATIINTAHAAGGAEGQEAAIEQLANQIAAAPANAGAEILQHEGAISAALEAAGVDENAADAVAAGVAAQNEAIGNAGDAGDIINLQETYAGNLQDAVDNDESIEDAVNTAAIQETIEAAEALIDLSPVVTTTIDPTYSALGLENGLTIEGTGRPDSTIKIVIGDQEFTTTADTVIGDGQPNSWSITIPRSELPEDGAYDIEISASSDGAVFTSAQSFATAIDTQAPEITLGALPTVLNAAMLDTGLEVTGTTEPGATVTIAIVDATAGSGAIFTTEATADETGAFSVDLKQRDFDGNQGDLTLQVSGVDAAGNAGEVVAHSFAVDTLAPATPDPSKGPLFEGVNADYLTQNLEHSFEVLDDVTQVMVKIGTAEKTFDVSDGEVQVSFAPNELPADGELELEIISYDAAGNPSAPFNDLITVDRTAPEAPTLGELPVLNPELMDGPVDLVVSGLEADANIQYRFEGESEWRGLAEGVSAGEYTAQLHDQSFVINGNALTDGTHTLEVRQVDSAGNAGPAATVSVEIDAEAPAAITLPELANVLAETADDDYTITLTTEPNATVQYVINDDGVTPGESETWLEVTANAAGVAEITLVPSDAFATDAEYSVFVRAVDAVGNAGEIVSSTLTVDRSAPDAVVVEGDLMLTIDEQEAVVINGHAVEAGAYQISIQSEAGSQLQIKIPDQAGGFILDETVTVDQSGTFLYDLDAAAIAVFSDGQYTATIVNLDAAGNAGPEVEVLLVVDSTIPDAPVVFSTKDGTPQGEPIALNAADTEFVAKGSAANNAKVLVTFNGETQEVTADASGLWQATFDNIPTDVMDDDGADYPVSAVQVSALEVPSTAGSANLRVDLVTPDAPSVTVTEAIYVTDSGEEQITISIPQTSSDTHYIVSYKGQDYTVEQAANGATVYTITHANNDLTDNDGSLTVVAADQPGNTSSPVVVEFTLVTDGPTNADDNLVGTAADDALDGMDGDDTLNGGEGDDTLTGGDGQDLFIYTGGHDVIADMQVDPNDLAAGDIFNDHSDFTDAEVETAIANATAVTVDGAGAVRVALDADNSLTFVGYTVEQLQTLFNVTAGPVPINGTAGADQLDGTASGELISGLAGNDVLSGLAGDDTLVGGTGNDVMDGGAGDDVLIDGQGTDSFVYSGGHDVFIGVTLDEQSPNNSDVDLTSHFSADAIEQAVLNATLISDFTSAEVTTPTQATVLRFGANDTLTLVGYTPAQILQAYQSSGGANDDDIEGTDEDDTLNGSGNGEDIRGFDGNDTLYGLGGEDYLDGGAGDDRLLGGEGDDTLHGDDGNDTYVYTSGHDAIWSFVPSEDTIEVAVGLDFAEALAQATSTTIEHDQLGTLNAAVLSFGDDDTLTVVGFTADQLRGALGGSTPPPSQQDEFANVFYTDGDEVRTVGDDGEDLVILLEVEDPGAVSAILDGVRYTATSPSAGQASGEYTSSDHQITHVITIPFADLPTESGRLGLTYELNDNGNVRSFGDNIDFDLAGQSFTVTDGSSVNGTEYGDHIIGSDDHSNTIAGNGGNDYIDAGIGADVIDGGAGEDMIVLKGDDTVTGGARSDVFIYNGGNVVITDFSLRDQDGDILQSDVFTGEDFNAALGNHMSEVDLGGGQTAVKIAMDDGGNPDANNSIQFNGLDLAGFLSAATGVPQINTGDAALLNQQTAVDPLAVLSNVPTGSPNWTIAPEDGYMHMLSSAEFTGAVVVHGTGLDMAARSGTIDTITIVDGNNQVQTTISQLSIDASTVDGIFAALDVDGSRDVSGMTGGKPLIVEALSASENIDTLDYSGVDVMVLGGSSDTTIELSGGIRHVVHAQAGDDTIIIDPSTAGSTSTHLFIDLNHSGVDTVQNFAFGDAMNGGDTLNFLGDGEGTTHISSGITFGSGYKDGILTTINDYLADGEINVVVATDGQDTHVFEVENNPDGSWSAGETKLILEGYGFSTIEESFFDSINYVPQPD